ncbi:MAG: helix-turn-helix domain-containing protein [Bacteroidota bacterium]
MSHHIKLSTEESYFLADKMQTVANKKLSRRLLAISLLHYGYSVRQVALLTGVSTKTVSGWLKLFVEEGFDGLLSLHYPKERNSRLQPYQSQIQQFWVDHPDATLQQLQAWLKEKHRLEVEYSWLYRYLELHRLLPGSDRDLES